MDESGIGPDPSGPDNGKSSHSMASGKNVIVLYMKAVFYVLLFCYFDKYFMMCMYYQHTDAHMENLLLKYSEISHIILYAFLISRVKTCNFCLKHFLMFWIFNEVQGEIIWPCSMVSVVD